MKDLLQAFADTGLRPWDPLWDMFMALEESHQQRIREIIVTFVEGGFNWTVVSEKLFIHRNTTKFRMEKFNDAFIAKFERDPEPNDFFRFWLLLQMDAVEKDPSKGDVTEVEVGGMQLVITMRRD